MLRHEPAPLATEPGLLGRLPEPPRKVALVRPSRIGDFICATPAFRALRRALPEAEITMITLPLLRDLVDRSPHLDRFAAFPGYPGLAEQFFDARRATAFFQQMQAESFDLAVQMHGSGVNSNPFTLLVGARATAGYIRAEDGPGCLDAALPMPMGGHEVQCVLAMATFLGAEAQGTETEFPLWDSDHAAAADLLRDLQPPFIGLHAGARDPSRLWPIDRFARVGAELRDRWRGTLLVLGGPEERARGQRLRRAAGRPCVNLAGHTSLPVLGAILSRLSLLVTNDSGPAHIAYALGTPTVTIFGSSDPVRYGRPRPGPFRLVLPPADALATGSDAVRQVTTEQVIAAAEELWEGHRA